MIGTRNDKVSIRWKCTECACVDRMAVTGCWRYALSKYASFLTDLIPTPNPLPPKKQRTGVYAIDPCHIYSPDFFVRKYNYIYTCIYIIIMTKTILL